MAMVRKIDKENGHKYIIADIDDRTCLVKEIMDTAMGVDAEDEVDKDSDLD